MLRLITRQESIEASDDVVGMIYGGEVDSTRTWVETAALIVTEVQGKPFDRYYVLVITDMVCEEDMEVLQKLSVELGRSLADCVVEKETIFEPHPDFPGSMYFNLVTVYGG